MSTAVNDLAPISDYMIVGFFAVVFVLAAIARLIPHPPRVRANPPIGRLREAMTASAGYRAVRLPAGRVTMPKSPATFRFFSSQQ